MCEVLKKIAQLGMCSIAGVFGRQDASGPNCMKISQKLWSVGGTQDGHMISRTDIKRTDKFTSNQKVILKQLA